MCIRNACGTAATRCLAAILLFGSGGFQYALPDEPPASAVSTGAAADTRTQKPGTDLYGDPLPAGAAARLGSVRFRTAGGPVGMGFAADNETLVAATRERRIVLLNSTTGRMLREIGTADLSIDAMWLTPNRRAAITTGTLSAAEAGTRIQAVRIWDLQTGKLRSKLERPAKAERRWFGMTPDGRHLLGADDRGLLSLWDLDTDREVTSTISHGPVTGAALSPDGRTIAASTRNGVYFWDWQSTQEPAQVGEGGRVLAFSLDGTLLAENRPPNSVIIRNVASHKVVRELLASDKETLSVRGMSFTPDGRLLAAANGAQMRDLTHRVHVWDVATGAVQREFAIGNQWSKMLALSLDGHRLAVAGDQSAIRVWDLETGAAIGQDGLAHEDLIADVRFSPSGEQVVTASDDGTVRVWQAATGRQLRATSVGRWVRGVDVSPDGRLIATSGLDDAVRVFDAASGAELQRFVGHGRIGGVRAVGFSRDGRSLRSWGDDTRLLALDLAAGTAADRELCPAAVPIKQRGAEARSRGLGPTFSAAISSGANRIAIGHDLGVAVFDLETAAEIYNIEAEDGLLVGLALSADGARLATSTWGKPVETELPDGRIASSSEKNHMLHVKDIASTRELLRVVLPRGVAGPVAFSADGSLLAFASLPPDNRLRVFQLPDGEERVVADALPAAAQCLAFSPRADRVVCGFADGTAIIWNVVAAK